MVSAPRFKPVIPDLVRVLVQKETNWGVDPWVDFLGRWRIKAYDSTATQITDDASTALPEAGEMVIALNAAGAGYIYVHDHDANGDDLDGVLAAVGRYNGSTSVGDHLMLGGEFTFLQNANRDRVGQDNAHGRKSVFEFAVGDVIPNDHDGVTGGSGIGAINVAAGGTGYSSAPTVAIEAPPEGGIQATATATVGSGAVTGFTITNAGYGYDPDDPPTVTLTGGGGSNAAGTAVVGGQVNARDFFVGRRIAFGASHPGYRRRVIVPCEPISIMEEIQYFTDENYRGRFARDFDVYGGTRMVTGSLTGNVYLGSDAFETTTHSPLGHLLAGFWGSERTVRIGTSPFYVHNFYSTDIPGSLSLEVQDNINEQTGVAAGDRDRLTPVYLGTMLERFSMSFDANDGLMTYSTDFKGRNQVFMDPPEGRSIASLTITTAGSGVTVGTALEFTANGSGARLGRNARGRVTSINGSGGVTGVELLDGGFGYVGTGADGGGTGIGWLADGSGVDANGACTLSALTRYPESDKTGEASIGWHGSVYFGESSNTNPLPTTGKLLSAELSLDREIDMHSTEGDNQLPTIRPTRPVRATFTATVEFTDYEDLKRYSDDNYANDDASDFTDNANRWIFRFANKRNISTDLPDTAGATSYGLAGDAGAQLDADSDGVLDIVFHAAAYSESPVSINRGEFSNTLEFSCRAFLEEAPDWYAADPGTGTAINNPDPGAEPTRRGSRVVQMRLINKKSTPY